MKLFGAHDGPWRTALALEPRWLSRRPRVRRFRRSLPTRLYFGGNPLLLGQGPRGEIFGGLLDVGPSPRQGHRAPMLTFFTQGGDRIAPPKLLRPTAASARAREANCKL